MEMSWFLFLVDVCVGVEVFIFIFYFISHLGQQMWSSRRAKYLNSIQILYFYFINLAICKSVTQ